MYQLIVGTFVLKETYNRTCNSATVVPQNLWVESTGAVPPRAEYPGDDPDDMGRMVGWWEKYPHKPCTSSVKKQKLQPELVGQFFGGISFTESPKRI